MSTQTLTEHVPAGPAIQLEFQKNVPAMAPVRHMAGAPRTDMSFSAWHNPFTLTAPVVSVKLGNGAGISRHAPELRFSIRLISRAIERRFSHTHLARQCRMPGAVIRL